MRTCYASSTQLRARLGNGERELGWMRNEERPWRVLKEAEVNFERGSWLWPTFRSYWLFFCFRRLRLPHPVTRESHGRHTGVIR